MSTKDELMKLADDYADATYAESRDGRTDDSESKAARLKLETAIGEACDTGLTPEQSTASKLVDAWTSTNRRPCPWKVAVEITAIVTHMTHAEKVRLLALESEMS